MSEPNEEIRLAVLRGRADERERIIKLLDAYFEKWFAVENPNDYEVGRTDGVAACTALIKDKQ